MSVYVDSGVLVKLYIREPNSAQAAAVVREHPVLPLNGLLELEVRNSFRALESRGVLTGAQRTAAEHFLDLDCVEGRLQPVPVDWTAVLQHSIALGRSFTSQTLARSLDILHIALALHLQCGLFITADRRQAEFARCCKLPVVLIT